MVHDGKRGACGLCSVRPRGLNRGGGGGARAGAEGMTLSCSTDNTDAWVEVTQPLRRTLDRIPRRIYPEGVLQLSWRYGSLASTPWCQARST